MPSALESWASIAMTHSIRSSPVVSSSPSRSSQIANRPFEHGSTLPDTGHRRTRAATLDLERSGQNWPLGRHQRDRNALSLPTSTLPWAVDAPPRVAGRPPHSPGPHHRPEAGADRDPDLSCASCGSYLSTPLLRRA